MADDKRFIALNIRNGFCADNDLCTANGYVTALEGATGKLRDRPVLVIGLGPVGRAAVRRLVAHGARVLAVEPDHARAASVASDYDIAIVSLEEGLAATDLFFDAAPVADLIDFHHVSASSLAAVPAVPSSFTAAAQTAPAARHIHEPLAVGVCVMAVGAVSGLGGHREAPLPRWSRVHVGAN
jgi:NAD(P)-dependent dehydrogenase (short-subunit alcohol dehydrogenase family)